MVNNAHYQRDLGAYVGVYLREEIQAEGLTRSIGNFGRVLEMAAQYNGQQVNFTQIGSDAQVPPRTVRDYFQLFEDTLIGAILPTFLETKTRKAVSTPKFYLFDVGVARALRREGEIVSGSRGFGDALEHLVFLEIRAYLDYTFSRCRLSYWRSQSKFEVDFVIDNKIAIGVKGSTRVSTADLKGIKALAEEVPLKRKIVVCSELAPRFVDGIEIMHFDKFFTSLWRHEIISPN
jgi:predicted AAA+ superfamily ATPase